MAKTHWILTVREGYIHGTCSRRRAFGSFGAPEGRVWLNGFCRALTLLGHTYEIREESK